jgi:hypothetical protein
MNRVRSPDGCARTRHSIAIFVFLFGLVTMKESEEFEPNPRYAVGSCKIRQP